MHNFYINFRHISQYQVGNWSTINCPDPQKLYEELIFSKEEMIKAIDIKLPNGTFERHTNLNVFNWTHSSRMYYGRCYHLHIFQVDIHTIRLLPTNQQTLEVFVHDVGLWKTYPKTSYHQKVNVSMLNYMDIKALK